MKKILIATALLTACLFGTAAAASGGILVAEFKGPVTPVLASYVDRTLSTAEAENAGALIIEMDTPGGSVDIMQGIVQRISSSSVPVIVYVAPRGAHAGSAGTFITLAAHMAAMAPGSSIGAASPVGSEGADLPDTMKAKATNILVADIKGLAARRGERAAAWAEKAVAEAAAATADEALALGVIDAVAPDVPSLIAQLDGRPVTIQGATRVLKLQGMPIQRVPLSPLENFLNTLVNPALAAILMTLGLNALLFEISSPGGHIPGLVGAVCLLLALYSLGTLNANWVGLGFVVLAFVLFLLDIKAPTHGVLSIGGLVSFVFGSFLLFDSTGYGVPWATILILAGISAAFFAFAIAKALAIQHKPPVTGMEGLIGQVGVVRAPLTPEGMVLVTGELWRACLASGEAPLGAQVMVVGHKGYTLLVQVQTE